MTSTTLERLRVLYGMDKLELAYSEPWQPPRVLVGRNIKANRESAVRVSAPDSHLAWYSALERLADELRADVDRAGIKAEVLELLRNEGRKTT